MVRVRNYLSLMLAFALLFGTVSLTNAQDATPTPAAEEEMANLNIVETAIVSGQFSTLVAAIEVAGLVETLSGEGPFTVFAPTDDAFAALPDGTLDSLLAEPTGALADLLLDHVVVGEALSTELSDGMTIETVGGGTLTVHITDDGVMINDARVVTADVLTSNGVIHVIDTVLVPTAEEEMMAEATATPVAEEEMANLNIVETAIVSDQFSTLVAAIQAAGLVETLSGEGPFTVFAPTDDAFAALPDGTLDSLLDDPMGALADILLYHVVVGEALSTELSDGMTIETVGGGTLTVRITDDGVMINDARVVTADVLTSNGVIHVIDTVLVPAAEEEMMAEATATPVAEEEMMAEATATPAAEEATMAEATATPAAEEEMVEAAMATGTPAAEEEAMAPETLPVTGGNAAENGNSALPWTAAALVVVLAGGALFIRRRAA